MQLEPTEMRLHHAVQWSLRVEHTRRSLAHCKDFARSFPWHWTAGPRGSAALIFVRLNVSTLLEDVELWLRGQVEAEFKKAHGSGWWAAIPKDVQGRVEYRHKLARAEFGARRAGIAHSARWLSFGDTLKVLDGLSRDSWVRCLDATAFCKQNFSRTARKVKAFRDGRIAHVQSGGPTITEVSKVLGHIEKLCQLLRPQDYILSLAARKVLLSKHVARHRAALFDHYEPGHRANRATRLRVLGRILPPSPNGVPRDLNLAYYDALLVCCAEAQGTISEFVGETDETDENGEDPRDDSTV
jgi:hypothetical protein